MVLPPKVKIKKIMKELTLVLHLRQINFQKIKRKTNRKRKLQKVAKKLFISAKKVDRREVRLLCNINQKPSQQARLLWHQVVRNSMMVPKMKLLIITMKKRREWISRSTTIKLRKTTPKMVCMLASRVKMMTPSFWLRPPSNIKKMRKSVSANSKNRKIMRGWGWLNRKQKDVSVT